MSQVFADDYLLSLGGRQEYTVTISARGAELTGVCIIRTDEGGSKGTIMNELCTVRNLPGDIITRHYHH